ncbi:acinetodin/klebsidin/J25 family lasso peptide (plasmid) [Klebsiella sp. B345]|uniref:acinetodin/klebsidin/J25 family lasso peptide n=1 Tax=Klebsiella sp. B345 TaxID=2755398 RepID=UPI003DA8ECB1
MSVVKKDKYESIDKKNSQVYSENIIAFKVNGKASLLTKGGDGGIPEYFSNGEGPVDASQGNRYG